MADDTLLERDDQARAIDEALAAGRRSDGRVLVIEGPPGIGKSRLLMELRRRAEGRARVLVARASRLEQAFAFGVVRQLLEAAVRDPAVSAFAFEGAASGARDVFTDTPSEGGAASYAMLHGLHWLTLNLAEEQPVVMVVDDLHWCDASSLRFLAYLARRLDGTSVVLAASTRPVGTTPDPGVEPVSELLAELLGALTAEPSAVHLHPQPLSRVASAALLEDQLGAAPDDAFAQACFDATDGNPLLLRQLAHSLQAEGTDPTAANAATVRRVAHRALARTVLARVGRLSATTVAVARSVAVLGETASVPLVAELTGATEDAVVQSAGELVEAEVLRRDQHLGFVHALVRDAVYFDLPEAQRQQQHAAAARLLASSGAPVERIASQLELSPRRGDAWAVEIAEAAAAAALGRGAPDAAAAYLRRALEEPPAPEHRAALAHRLGTTLVDVNGPAAVAALRDAADRTTDPLARAAIEAELLQVLVFTGGHHEANGLARARMETLPEDAADLRGLYASFRANAVMFGATDPTAFEPLRTLRSTPPGPDDGPGSRVLASLSSLAWLFDGGTAQECTALALWSIAGNQQILRRQPMPATAALFTLSQADRDEALAVWEGARAEAHQTGAQLLHWTIDVWLGAEHQRRGDLGRAIESLREASIIGRRWTAGTQAAWGDHFSDAPLALALVEQGQIDEARAVLQRTPPSMEGSPFSTLLWLHAAAHVRIAEGRLDEAIELTLQQERRSPWMPTPIGLDWRQPRAVALHRAGRTEDALAVARDSLRIAEHWGAPGAIGPALRVVGELLGADGHPELERSVAELERSTARLELAKSLAALGAARRRDRQPTEARDPLERAYELARACDATAVAGDIRTELAAAGVRRHRDEAGGAGALTPSERRVADLAAGGRTNREIAQELFVTPKTVEVHLSAAYRKLGIASRHGLAGALVA